MTAAGRQTLQRARRIRHRPEFERVYNGGSKIHGRYMTVFFVSNARQHMRLGIAATRKLGSAVERNRAKRLAREVFRRHTQTSALDVVIVPRREMLDAPFTSVEAEYLRLLEQRDRARPAGDGRRGRNARRPARV